MCDYLSTLDIIGIDTENNGLDCHKATHLLLSIGDENKSFVIDRTSIGVEWLKALKHKRFIGANLKYDQKILLKAGIEIPNIYDVMLVEQIIRMGHKGGNSLDKILERRAGVVTQFEKSTRDDFIKMKSNRFERKHIIYSAEDISYLSKIKDAQESFITNYGMEYLLYNIEFPLSFVIAKAEFEGIPFNKTKWKQTVIKNKRKKKDIIDFLDKETIKIVTERNPKLLSGKYTRERKQEELLQTDLFGQAKEIVNKNLGNINYSSDAQIKELFKDVNEPVPLVKDKKTHKWKESTGKDAVEKHLKDHPHTIFKDFIPKFLEFQSVDKEISAFGMNFIEAVNPISKNIHTIYRQAMADTGRFQSGGGQFEPDKINSQQIPQDNRYRTCFGGDSNYKYLTIDLTGAEAVILASNANDLKLKAILDDPHSALATAAYRGIIKYILDNMCKDYRVGLDLEDSLVKKRSRRAMQELTDLLKTKDRAREAFTTGTFTVTKKESKDLRNSFKPIFYGLAYGASTAKIAEVLNISMVYAEIVEKALRKVIPKTFTYLDESSKFGYDYGYIITCKKVNSRRWFKKLIDARRSNANTFFIKGEVERQSKNAGIQGTQAFMVKEASVEVDNYLTSNNIDGKILMWIHDELFIRLPKDKAEEYAKDIKKIICDTCNTFLNEGFEMDADYEIADTWVK
jgi:DNA polymerase-1